MEQGFKPAVARLGYTPQFPTNRNLTILLRDTFGKNLADVYATNLFPFIKLGEIDAKIPEEYLDEAAKNFALPQIRIVKPKLVICLGLPTFNALWRTCGQPKAQRGGLREAIDHPFTFGHKEEKIQIYCQAHTGQWVWKNGGGKDQVRNDWLKMKAYLDRSR